MARATAVASVRDSGVVNVVLPESISKVWIDRDLSWLEFNARVLAEAEDERTPLLERAKFLAIFTSSLDELFMKRIAHLRHAAEGQGQALICRLREKLIPMLQRQADCFRSAIVPELAAHGIFLKRWEELSPSQKEEASQYFEESLSPALTPLVISRAHPFPFLSNLSCSLTFCLVDAARPEPIYARVKVPTGLKQWVPLKAGLAQGERHPSDHDEPNPGEGAEQIGPG